MTDSPLLPNLPELTLGLAEGSLAKSVAEACEGAESEAQLAERIGAVVDARLAATRQELENA